MTETTQYIPPLAVSFIWHFADAKEVEPILAAVKKAFARDKDKPFSRGLNIPLFFFSSQSSNEAPLSYPAKHSKRNLVFVFTSTNTMGHRNWTDYIQNIPNDPSVCILPIAVDRNGLRHTGTLSGLNCIRLYDWPKSNNEAYAIIALAHEIYRYGCKEIDPEEVGKASSISIFLSHAKAGDTGRLHAEEIKKFIDNTNMNRFFDANEISPGFSFEQEIEKHIPSSTLLAIESDAYSSRYWCQREILSAKKHGCPIVVMDCLNDYEDRLFPAASNVPCIHVSADTPLSEKDILRVLSAVIIETVRYHHSLSCLEGYKLAGWIDSNCELTARPPEIRQALALKKNNNTKICYPEPPIYFDEADWHHEIGIETFTPLWKLSENNSLKDMKIGISISDTNKDGFVSHHTDRDHLIRLSQDLARHLLARSGTLIYGGDLRPSGFTEFILDEAMILKERISSTTPHVENHLAWPLYVSEKEIVAWRAKYSDVMHTEEYAIPSDVADGISKDIFLAPNTPQNAYVWSRCLTDMREKSISTSTARVCAGGRQSGYKGKMPGVLEEIMLAFDEAKPIFLLGGFGGIVGDVCSVILNNDLPDSLTEDWQISHNERYAELQKIAHTHRRSADYEVIAQTIQQLEISEIAARAGLDELEYRKLMFSPFVDECVYLVLKGLRTICLQPQENAK